ncbi:MAG: GntR family transcriptional regulator, partial [Xanthomonadales bacterium]|nr:GntR family transcriptional regulator [Xanthomonadales bacterium]
MAAARLSEQAYAALEQRLVTLDLPPGMLVTERDLVELTGIGRTPVREAVLRLADEGLLQVLPRKGLQVAPVSRRQLARVLELRRAVERLVVTAA